LMIPTGLLGGQDYLTWNQVTEMVHSGLAYVGDHTWSHYSITHGPADKINFEIATGKQQLQDYTGQNVNIFTYPYGSFSNNAITALRQNGITGAFSEIPGHWQCDSFVMALHRTRIGNSSLANYGF
jgi:peptidoglycan/xylan/chitin deacetylase (PgdA/CDA1 family)